MVSGYGKIIGIVKINVKIFQKDKDVLIFVIDSKDFDHEFLIGLDLISKFKLCQDEHLRISQVSENIVPKNFQIDKVTTNLVVNSVEITTDLSHLDKRE